MTLDNTTGLDNRLPNIVLAMETSTVACSVALQVGDSVQQLYEEGVNLHSLRLLQMIDELLQKQNVNLADIELLAVSTGPGAFTGLRIGVGVAQGLAYSHSIPVLGVSSLQAMSYSSSLMAEHYVVAGLDARMAELYWAVFKVSAMTSAHRFLDRVLLGELSLHAPQDLRLPMLGDLPVSFVGNAWPVYFKDFAEPVKEMLEQSDEDVKSMVHYPQARWVLEQAVRDFAVGKVMHYHQLAPEYVRDNVAKKSTKKPLS